jgi:hypothetical protein
MGIVNPRPAMRRREARTVVAILQRHDELARHIMSECWPAQKRMDYQLASGYAYHLVRTSSQRKKVWGK